MGSGERLKPTGRPRQVNPSGVAEEWRQPGDVVRIVEKDPSRLEEEPIGLLVDLVRIEASTHAKSSVGEPVSLINQDGRIAVATAIGRLGDIPPERRREVRRLGITHGFIHKLTRAPVGARVILVP